MQKRRLGSTNIFVSPIGLGTVKFGRNQGVKYPTAFSLPNDDDILNLLSIARELGVNLLDTAPAYGTSEERLGQCLKGQREHWIISTKVGEEFIDDKSYFNFSAQHVRMSVERSLKRLRTDYLDIVLGHSNGADLEIIQEEKLFETLSDLKQEGKIRAFGMSTKTVAGGLETIKRSDVAMVTYNLKENQDKKVIDFAHVENKGIFVKKALASGHAVDMNVSLRFAIDTPGVTSVIIGTINTKHLQDNIGIARSD